MTDPQRRASRAAGFTLLEILVALTILAVSLGTLFDIFSGVIGHQKSVGDERAAIMLAQSKLEGLGSDVALVDGASDGRFGNGFGWRLQIEPYQPESSNSFLAPKLVTLTVFWPHATGPRSLSVRTVRVVGRE